jgi:hypothetical protein
MMAIDLAQRRVNDFRQRCGSYGETALHLAYHAALPVALNAELLHLLRINFFLDPPEPLPPTVEFEFLLSPLCREIDEGLYEIEPDIRDRLLAGLSQTYGAERTRDIATLLWQYVDHHSPWRDRVELERAQQLTALNFLNPQKAQQWLAEVETEVTQGRAATREWYVAMRQEVENHPLPNQAEENIHALVAAPQDQSNDLAKVVIPSEEISGMWKSRLDIELQKLSSTNRDSIVRWLIGENPSRLNDLPSAQRQIAEQAMDYRYRILQERYLGVGPDRAYQRLIQRLSSLFLIRNKIKTWIALSRDRQRSVVEVLQEVIQELLQNDDYIQQQIAWINQCTADPKLRNALVLTTAEEYCLRPIRNQPLLVYRFVNYLRRSQQGGMTQVPTEDIIRLVSGEFTLDDVEGNWSLLDAQAVSEYKEAQIVKEPQEVEDAVLQQFEAYRLKKVEPLATLNHSATGIKAMLEAVIAETGIEIPQKNQPFWKNISFNSIALQLCGVLWWSESQQKWSLLWVLREATGQLLPKGLHLEIKKSYEVLQDSILEVPEKYFSVYVEGNLADQFSVTVSLEGEKMPPLTFAFSD